MERPSEPVAEKAILDVLSKGRERVLISRAGGARGAGNRVSFPGISLAHSPERNEGPSFRLTASKSLHLRGQTKPPSFNSPCVGIAGSKEIPSPRLD